MPPPLGPERGQDTPPGDSVTPSARTLGRRTFLARMGVLGAVVATGGLFTDRALAMLPSAESPLDDLVGKLTPVLAELARDTLNGFVVMVCPGQDEYSAAQGTPRPEDGAMEAKVTDFLIESLDNYVPFPDRLGVGLLHGLADGFGGTGVPLPADQLALPIGEINTLDAALSTMLSNDARIPLSTAVALVLNLVATQVNPAAVKGPFLSPFARLTYEEKCKAFEVLERADADLIDTLDSHVPESFTETLSGTVKFIAGAILEFAAYGSFNEWAVFDAENKTISELPVGWRLTGYQPDGVVDGWDEFLGYYQDRMQVTN